MVTLLTVLCRYGGTEVWVPPAVAAAEKVYVPGGAAVPLLLVPSQVKLVRLADPGVTCMVLTSAPDESVTFIVTAVAPAGAGTAPLTEPPAASAAVVPAASTWWPMRFVPVSSCDDCMVLERLLIEVCMPLMPLTSLREASSLTN